MNEDQLERKLKHLMQQLDAELSSGRITRKDYNKEVKTIKKQAAHYRMQNSKGKGIVNAKTEKLDHLSRAKLLRRLQRFLRSGSTLRL